jgi:hypothetical protein
VDYPVVAVPAGNGVGKSRVGSGIALWFALCHPDCRVVIAAPTTDQLKKVLWAELTGAYQTAADHGRYLGGRFGDLSLDFGDAWTIEGWGQGSVESKSGRHAGDLLAIIDEASGCKPSVLEAIDSLNPSRRLYLGNPLRAEGVFFETCSRENDPNTKVIRIPSLESPHIEWDRSPWGLADRTWLELSRSHYGEDSQWWLSHVLAQFPGELSQTLLPAAWLLEASRIVHVRSGPVWLGIDLSLGVERDETCLVWRDDTGVIGSEASARWGLEKAAERAAVRCKEFAIKPEHVVFDSTGIGADFANRLRAVGVLGAKAFSGARSGGERFANLRTASAWALRRRLDPARKIGAATPGDAPRVYVAQKPFAIPAALVQKYRPELQQLRCENAPDGSLALEPKEALALRIKRSPNFLDALSMTFAYPNA